MTPTEKERRRRDLSIITNHAAWPNYPLLPLVNYHHKHFSCGVMFDCLGMLGKPGFSSTVFLANIFDLPDDPSKLFKLKRLVFDTPEELLDAGWTVD